MERDLLKCVKEQSYWIPLKMVFSIQLIEANEEALSVHIPNHIYGLWIDSNYMAILNHAIVEVLGHPRKVRWHSDSVAAEDESNDLNKPETDLIETGVYKPAARSKSKTPTKKTTISANDEQLKNPFGKLD